jgi:hypothetical protein
MYRLLVRPTLGARWQFLIWNARIRNSNCANCTQGMLRAEAVFVTFMEPRNRFRGIDFGSL